MILAGSTIRNIAVARRTGTEARRIGLAVRHAATRWPTARLVLGNKLAGRAAICPAIGLAAELASVIEPGVVPVLATGQALAARIA